MSAALPYLPPTTNPRPADLDLDGLTADPNLNHPEGYDPSDEDEWYAEMDQAYEAAHMCVHGTTGMCPHCDY